MHRAGFEPANHKGCALKAHEVNHFSTRAVITGSIF